MIDVSRDVDEKITVFLMDDHEIVRRGVADALELHTDIEVVGEAASVGEAMVRIPACRPDVALLDMRMPDGDGIEVCREINSVCPATRSIILTSYEDNDAIMAAVMAGAAGYLLKHVRGAEIADAIRTVAAGRSLLDPIVTQRLLTKLREPAPSNPITTLTARERDVLDLIAEGMPNRAIAARLLVSEKTVKNHVTAVLQKLGLTSRTQAALYVARRAQG